MYKYKFTVFTPTYNRSYILENLYNDLKEQTFKDFEWLIVDDGSKDDTKNLVDKFKNENLLNIRYIYKENGGKHTAINLGVEKALGELFFIVDSDDGLVNDAIEVVNETWGKSHDKNGLCGVMGLCVYKNIDLVGTNIPEDKSAYHLSDLYYKLGMKGDKTLVFLTDILRKYPFPERDGIKFLPESVVWNEISKDYKMLCTNKPLRVVEYLEDGLTMNKFKKSSLRGRALEYLYLTNQNTYPIDRYPYMWVKNYINLARYSLLSESSYYKEINKFGDKFMYSVCFPLGYYKYLKQKKHVK
jgi:glycosyltransferase involved in cell wall biosynthesis